ncbi:MAG: sec-independent protein translocase protein TatA [Actinomycetota bacterium]|jgi:sec-independent protein translocase protein TatA|nr:sec-independent protein translocase protein TatA [Actinomycetota bacterium]
MSNFKGWEIIIVLALLLLLFGAKRLPDAARGLGRSLRIFKAETKGLRDDDDDRESRSDQAERSDVRPAPRVLPGTVEDRDQGTPRSTEQQTER